MNEKDSERVEQCRQEVDESLRDLQGAHAEMAEMLNGITAEGALLANDIGSAVRGLQFQDRISQRIGHVIAELDTLTARLQTHAGKVVPGGDAVNEGFSAYTMQEERQVAGLGEVGNCCLPEMWSCFDRAHDLMGSGPRSCELKKVLIVDDSVSMRQMVSFTLRQGGFDVVEAEHGKDALEKLKAPTVDLVITDLNMPLMDGITLIRNLRSQPAMKSKPILMLTTESQGRKKKRRAKPPAPRAGSSSPSTLTNC